MHTKIFSARIIHAITYLQFLNRKIVDHNALATPTTNQNYLFAENGKQATSMGAYKQGKPLDLYETFKILTKHSSKSGSGLLRIYSLQCLTQNSLKRRVRQPLCDPSNVRKMDKLENQSLDDLLD